MFDKAGNSWFNWGLEAEFCTEHVEVFGRDWLGRRLALVVVGLLLAGNVVAELIALEAIAVELGEGLEEVDGPGNRQCATR